MCYTAGQVLFRRCRIKVDKDLKVFPDNKYKKGHNNVFPSKKRKNRRWLVVVPRVLKYIWNTRYGAVCCARITAGIGIDFRKHGSQSLSTFPFSGTYYKIPGPVWKRYFMKNTQCLSKITNLIAILYSYVICWGLSLTRKLRDHKLYPWYESHLQCYAPLKY